MKEFNPLVSIIVPVYNEEAVLPIFHQKIIDVIKP